MAKNDWIEVIEIFNKKSITYINNFLSSNDKFCPNNNHINIFDKNHNAFSSQLLNKPKPANWIPIYKREDLSDYLIQNNLMPIRCEQGEFFFFKGDVFYNLDEVKFSNINLEHLTQLDSFIPLTINIPRGKPI